MLNRRKSDQLMRHVLPDSMTIGQAIDLMLKVDGIFTVDYVGGSGVLEHPINNEYATITHNAIQEAKHGK